jgi:hypothetical protein
MGHHRSIETASVSVIVAVHLVGRESIAQLHKPAFLAQQEPNPTGGHFLISAGREDSREDEIAKIKDLGESR